MVYLVQLSFILLSKCLQWSHVIHVFNLKELSYVCQANKTQQFCIACNCLLPITITSKVQEGKGWSSWRACCEVSKREMTPNGAPQWASVPVHVSWLWHLIALSVVSFSNCVSFMQHGPKRRSMTSSIVVQKEQCIRALEKKLSTASS